MTGLPTRLLLTGAIAVLLAGCSGEFSIGQQQLSADEIERDIRGAYEAQTDIDLTRLTCEAADAEAGARIDCDGRNAKDVTLTIRGRVTAVEGDDASYRWEVVKAVAPGTLFAAEIGALLERRYGPVVAGVTCPDRVEVRKDEVVRCTATAENGDTGAAVIVLTDDDGAFTLKSFDGGAGSRDGGA